MSYKINLLLILLLLLAVVGLLTALNDSLNVELTESTNCAFSVRRQEPYKDVYNASYMKYSCVQLETARTPDDRVRGLSGRTYMDDTQGMLFVFDAPESACIWMKDMKFSLDIIWLDTDKKIIKIKEKVSPKTFPESFCSTSLAKYVIEVNAGVVRQAGLKLGQQLKL